MRLSYNEADEAFRAELIGWLDDNPPPNRDEGREPPQSSAHKVPWAAAWQRTLFDNGWLVPGWPPELGGRNASPVQQMIYFEEFTRRKIRRTMNPQGLSIITPSILDYGTTEQRERYALPTLRAEISWCLGMSEPNAGSDLASLTTRATIDGDRFIVNGQKVWTSGAQHADYCFCFVRTDPDAPKHKGISVLIIDMQTPGIEHRTIAELTEPDFADFNEVFFTDVEVPRENLIGELHDGWRAGMGSLAHERAMLWINYAYDLADVVDSICEAGRRKQFDARERDLVATAYIDAQSLQFLGYRGFAKFVKGEASPEHSLLKLYGSESLQRALLLGSELLGLDALDITTAAPSVWRRGNMLQQYLRSFGATIPGGTSEIQRNIIAERVLGLPEVSVRVAALIKQVPKFEAMELGPDGRLRREGLELEMNPYCRRAVAKAVDLARETGGTSTVITLGPPAADDSLREAIAWGIDEGVLISDPAFAGSDTLATARALAAAVTREGPFDLILVGRNSVDADTGQVGPELAELLDLPFVTGVKELRLREGALEVLAEEDDGYSERTVQLPAVISTAERLCDPAKVPPEGRAEVSADRIRTLTAADVGAGPWGQAGSPTTVGDVAVVDIERARTLLSGPVDEQVERAVELLVERGALDLIPAGDAGAVGRARPLEGPIVAVAIEPLRPNLVRELLGAAASVAARLGGHVVAVGPSLEATAELATWGADAAVDITGDLVEEDVAHALADWAAEVQPWAVLAPSTAWGREVASRAAARLGAGLTGDAIGLEVVDGRLVAWKPAFGGQLAAAITSSSSVQLATVRAGVMPAPAPRAVSDIPVRTIAVEPRGRVRVTSAVRDDDLDELAAAQRVIGVGKGVPPEDYTAIEPLLAVLDAQLAATRKVTDMGWLPRARQVGITGRSIAPKLYIALGIGGKFNHVVGVRAAGTVLAINRDPDALIFESADIGLVADWREVLPVLTERVAKELSR